MKNYTGFFIILFLLIAMIVVSTIQFSTFENVLLSKAYEMKNAPKSEIKSLYQEFESEFKKRENIMMMFINHATYKDISTCVLKIKHDIDFDSEYYLYIHIDQLVFHLQEMIDGEKSVFSNIF